MNIRTYSVNPKIPENLKLLEELSRDLWVSWNYDARMLFIRLDYDAWTASNYNPVRMLGLVSQSRYEELASDDSYLAFLEQVKEKYEKYKTSVAWYRGDMDQTIAYFSMEFGLDISLPIYSGGLGVLSGDHLKTSSDLGLPLVGVGLLYRQGYFRQYLNADGFQQESYPENDWYNMPVSRCLNENGEPIKITIDLAGSPLSAQIWKVRVGKISLYLLDSNIEENKPEFRRITASLYGGDRENRIRQEILLGVGGVRALKALGIAVSAAHMNEGHSAFLAMERIKTFMEEEGLSYEEAYQAVWSTNIFTTHTPVPAGNERFSIDLIQKYFTSVTNGIGISFEDFLALGRENPSDQQEPFCMTVLALKLSAYNNGVSELHGEVTREMWDSIWPDIPVPEIPITSITNGVHPRSWCAQNITELYDRYFGPRFYDEPTNFNVWNRMDRISNQELWRAHERNKERLVAFTRDRLKIQLISRGASSSQLSVADEVLSPYALTFSFARRFATYKRANLLFRDPQRLIRLLTDNDHPIQFIFSGKAHPHDIPGKELIKEIVHFASKPEIRSKIVFLENYDINIAKHLVSGSDVWLNNPRRPQEASGTSGMKAAINGVLNCSVLDGWWAEAYDPTIGWAIGRGEEYSDQELQDEIESKALFDLLEREIIPMYFNRGRDGLPREWIQHMKASMSKIGRGFSSHRMLSEYSNNFYLPALENNKRFSSSGFAPAKEITSYLKRLSQAWDTLRIVDVESNIRPSLSIGDTIHIEAKVELGDMQAEEIAVELYFGELDSHGQITDPSRERMQHSANSDGNEVFSADLECTSTGRQGFTVRILPHHKALVHPFIPDYIKWA